MLTIVTLKLQAFYDRVSIEHLLLLSLPFPSPSLETAKCLSL